MATIKLWSSYSFLRLVSLSLIHINIVLIVQEKSTNRRPKGKLIAFTKFTYNIIIKLLPLVAKNVRNTLSMCVNQQKRTILNR